MFSHSQDEKGDVSFMEREFAKLTITSSFRTKLQTPPCLKRKEEINTSFILKVFFPNMECSVSILKVTAYIRV